MAGKKVIVDFAEPPKQGAQEVTVFDPVGIWPGPGPLPGIEHPICLPGMPCWEQLPPVEELPSYKAGWNFRADGWYFYMGPTDKPRPVGPNFALDPELTHWNMGTEGWWLVSGPYDKPRPVFDVPPPVVEPPPQTEPLPPGTTTKWVWTGAQWARVDVTILPPDVAQPKKK